MTPDDLEALCLDDLARLYLPGSARTALDLARDVAAETGVALSDIASQSRAHAHAAARHALWVALRGYRFSLAEIGAPWRYGTSAVYDGMRQARGIPRRSHGRAA